MGRLLIQYVLASINLFVPLLSVYNCVSLVLAPNLLNECSSDSRPLNDVEVPLVITAGFWSLILGQSTWPLPVTRVSDTVYWTTGRLNSLTG